MGAGEIVAVMHGANGPMMMKMVEEELEKDRLVRLGELERTILHLEDAVPGFYLLLYYIIKNIQLDGFLF